MQKSQLLLALFLVLSLVFASVDAIPCKFCNQQACRKSCKNDMDYCKQYSKEHNSNEPCLSYYYICMGTCSVSPTSIDETTATADELAAAAAAAAAMSAVATSALNETVAL